MARFNRSVYLDTLHSQNRQAALFDRALAARALLETKGWTRETAYQGIEIYPDDPISRGQCGVSSVWLARALHEVGFDAVFTEGKIYVADHVNGSEHVWVEVRNVGDEPLVVDITSDQYKSPLGSPVHVGVYMDDSEIIGRYTPESYCDPYEVPRKKLMGRYAILEANIIKSSQWYQRIPLVSSFTTSVAMR